MILWHVVDELLETTANSADKVVILEITGNSCMTNEVKSVTDVQNGDRDRLRLDKFIDSHVDLVTISGNEIDWCGLEQLIALSIEFFF